jgi:transposase-like protein
LPGAPDAKMSTLYPIIHERVMPASTDYTDDFMTNNKLAAKENGYITSGLPTRKMFTSWLTSYEHD